MTQEEQQTLIILQLLCEQDERREFAELLDSYDWHYFQSDDRMTYLKGQYQWEKIKELMKYNVTFYFMYYTRADKIYNK